MSTKVIHCGLLSTVSNEIIDDESVWYEYSIEDFLGKKDAL